MKQKNNTYWSGRGKYQKEFDMMDVELPKSGYTGNPYMDCLITVSNLYFDACNNGGCNVEELTRGRFDRYVKPLFPELSILDFVDCCFEAIERAMDKVISYVFQQDRRYDKSVA